jgi:septal ring factor EnvC (AmiA/AmiB activator)
VTNLDNVTTAQIFGAFKIKHWIAVISAIFTCLTFVAGAAYWAGQKLAVSEAMQKQSELLGIIAELKSELKIYQSQLDQLRNSYEKIQSAIASRDQKIDSLSAELEKANNCAFIHNQIKETKEEMNKPNISSIFEDIKVSRENEQVRKAMLEKRLEIYQQQLANCGK